MSYNYLWEYSESVSDPWQTVGSSKTYTRYVGINDPDFNLRVTVTSGAEQESVIHSVTRSYRKLST